MKPSIYDVFVPGGLPRVTYVSRISADGTFDQQLKEYLRERHKLLAIVGPTKAGKSVLVRTVIPDAICIAGGSVHTIEDFWSMLADALNVFQEETRERVEQASTSDEIAGEFGASYIVTAKVAAGGTKHSASSKRQSYSRTHANRQAALRELKRRPERVLFVDDFHYIDAAIQGELVRELRTPVFDGLAVVIAAVPHRAFDVTRVERDMTGRVKELDITAWTGSELGTIADLGFEALDLTTARSTVDRLARESFGSPLLMQDMCLQLCRDNDLGGGADRLSADAPIRSRPDPHFLYAPKRFADFFVRVSSQSPKDSYRRLASGAFDRTYLVDAAGRQVGLAEAVLRAIAVTMRDANDTPDGKETNADPSEFEIQQIVDSLREVLGATLPSGGQIRDVLRQMTEHWQATNAEPVLDFDRESDLVYVVDPFFAFFLKWNSLS